MIKIKLGYFINDFSQKTSGLCVLARRVSALKAPNSIVSSQNSCARVETSPEEMVQVERVSMGISLLMKVL